MLLMCFIDAIKIILGGNLTGLGMQAKASFVTVIASIVVSLPFASIFAFWFKMDISGFWYGLGLGLFVQIIFYLRIFKHVNWQAVALKVVEEASKQLDDIEYKQV